MRPASLVAWRWASLKYAGHRDDRLGHLLAEVVLGRLLQLLQDLGALTSGGADLLAAHVEDALSPFLARDDLVGDALDLLGHLFEAAADEALGAEDGVLGVGHGLALGDLADEDLALVVPCDDARRDARALLVDDDLGLAPFHDRDDAVGRAEVDADDLAHVRTLQNLFADEPRGALSGSRSEAQHSCADSVIIRGIPSVHGVSVGAVAT